MTSDDQLEFGRRGDWGELHAAAELARLFVLFEPIRDIGSDLVGHFYPALGPPEVTFHLQIKTGVKSPVRASTLGRWIDVVERQPVVIVKVEEVSFAHQRYGVIVFHDWLLDHPEVAAFARSVRFSNREYVTVPGRTQLKELMLAEADRVLHRPTAPFGYAHVSAIPLNERSALSALGQLRHAEVTADLLREFEFAPATRNLEHLWQRLADGYEIRPPTDLVHVDEHRQFRHFIRAMRSIKTDSDIEMPVATYAAVSVWRPLVTLFPASLDLLARVLQSRSRRTPLELRATFQLLGALSNIGDSIRASRSRELLLAVRDEFDNTSVHDYDQFEVSYAYQFALAEANGSNDRLLHFLGRRDIVRNQWTMRLNLDYYDGSDRATATALLRQRLYPRTRNEKTAKVMDFLIDTLPLPFDEARSALAPDE